MATGGTQRLKPLHNFTLPCDLRWGNQRLLPCMKLDSDSQISHLRRFSSTTTNDFSDHLHRRTTRQSEFKIDLFSDDESDSPDQLGPDSAPPSKDGDSGIAAMREQVMFDLQTAVDKMKGAIFKDDLIEGKVGVSEMAKPWNLRTRPAAFKTPARYGGGNDVADKDLGLTKPGPNSESLEIVAAIEKSPKRRRTGGRGIVEKKERAKFSVTLSRKEIEEDFMALVGRMPPRRPKKRPRAVQKQLDTLFPGLWLTEVTADMYKVQDEAAP